MEDIFKVFLVWLDKQTKTPATEELDDWDVERDHRDAHLTNDRGLQHSFVSISKMSL